VDNGSSANDLFGGMCSVNARGIDRQTWFEETTKDPGVTRCVESSSEERTLASAKETSNDNLEVMRMKNRQS
jgi:hypothetical protein